MWLSQWIFVCNLRISVFEIVKFISLQSSLKKYWNWNMMTYHPKNYWYMWKNYWYMKRVAGLHPRELSITSNTTKIARWIFVASAVVFVTFKTDHGNLNCT